MGCTERGARGKPWTRGRKATPGRAQALGMAATGQGGDGRAVGVGGALGWDGTREKRAHPQGIHIARADGSEVVGEPAKTQTGEKAGKKTREPHHIPTSTRGATGTFVHTHKRNPSLPILYACTYMAVSMPCVAGTGGLSREASQKPPPHVISAAPVLFWKKSEEEQPA